MRFYIFYIFLIASVFPSALLADPPLFKIKQIGLANFSTQRIYHQTDEALYKVNASCQVANKNEPCMQWGIEIEYSGIPDGAVLDCIATFSSPSEIVDNFSASGTKVSSFPFEYPFPSGSGVHFMPSFVQKDESDTGIVSTVTKCKLGKQEAFSAKYSINFGGL